METISINKLKEVKGDLLSVISENNDNKELTNQLLDIYSKITASETLDKNHTKVLGIDYGTRRLASCVDNTGGAFLIPGNRLVNMYLEVSNIGKKLDNVEKAGNANHPKVDEYEAKFEGLRLDINNYLNNTADYVVDYCNNNGITKIVAGKLGMACGLHIDYNNRMFSGIENFESKLINLCARHGIEYVSQDESYTSQADFLAGDNMPHRTGQVINPRFSGERIKNDYHSSTGITFNADINAALNILKRAGVDNIDLVNYEYLQAKNIKI